MEKSSSYREEFEQISDLAYSSLNEKVAGNFVSTLRHWADNKGIKFVVLYMKNARQQYMSNPNSLPKCWKRGFLRNFVEFLDGKHGAKGKHISNLHRLALVFKLLKVYSFFNVKRIGKASYWKLHDNLSREVVFSYELCEKYLGVIQPFTRERLPYMKPPFPSSSASTFVGSYTKPAKDVTLAEAAGSFYSFPRITLEFYEFLSQFIDLPRRDSLHTALTASDYEVVGKCLLIAKDGGLKERDIYIPQMVLQLAMEPLYQALSAIAKRYCRNLFIYDQEKGIAWVKEKISSHVVYTIDLEQASNWIPLDMQYVLLNRLLPAYKQDIRLFYRISTGFWETNYKDILLQHCTGQPMGFLPSFLSFSLLLYYILWSKSGFPREPDFAQIGDDLVTINPGHYDFLKEVGFQVNKMKSFASPDFAEFAGTIIMKDVDLMNYRMRVKTDPMSRVRSMGWLAASRYFKRNGMSEIHRKMSYLRHLPPPYGLSGTLEGSQISLSSDALLQLYEPRTFQANVSEPEKPLGYEQFEVHLQVKEALGDLLDENVDFLENVLPNGVRVGDLLNVPMGSLGPMGWSLDKSPRLLTETLSTFKVDDPTYKKHLSVVGNLFGFLNGVSIFMTSAVHKWDRKSKPLENLHHAWLVLQQHYLPKGDPMKTRISYLSLKPLIEHAHFNQVDDYQGIPKNNHYQIFWFVSFSRKVNVIQYRKLPRAEPWSEDHVRSALYSLDDTYEIEPDGQPFVILLDRNRRVNGFLN